MSTHSSLTDIFFCDQITARITKLSYGLDTNYVDPVECVAFVNTCDNWFLICFSIRVTQKVVAGVYQGVTTVELDVN